MSSIRDTGGNNNKAIDAATIHQGSATSDQAVMNQSLDVPRDHTGEEHQPGKPPTEIIPSDSFGRTTRLTKEPSKYHCNQCEKSFTRRGALKDHQQACHTDERPFKCSSCNKAFGRQRDRNRHQRLHTEEMGFCCKVQWGLDLKGCGRQFSREDGLVVHLRSKVGEACSYDNGLIGVISHSHYDVERDAYECTTQHWQFKPSLKPAGCGRPFHTWSDLLEHHQTTEGNRCRRNMIAEHARYACEMFRSGETGKAIQTRPASGMEPQESTPTTEVSYVNQSRRKLENPEGQITPPAPRVESLVDIIENHQIPPIDTATSLRASNLERDDDAALAALFIASSSHISVGELTSNPRGTSLSLHDANTHRHQIPGPLRLGSLSADAQGGEKPASTKHLVENETQEENNHSIQQTKHLDVYMPEEVPKVTANRQLLRSSQFIFSKFFKLIYWGVFWFLKLSIRVPERVETSLEMVIMTLRSERREPLHLCSFAYDTTTSGHQLPQNLDLQSKFGNIVSFPKPLRSCEFEPRVFDSNESWPFEVYPPLRTVKGVPGEVITVYLGLTSSWLQLATSSFYSERLFIEWEWSAVR